MHAQVKLGPSPENLDSCYVTTHDAEYHDQFAASHGRYQSLQLDGHRIHSLHAKPSQDWHQRLLEAFESGSCLGARLGAGKLQASAPASVPGRLTASSNARSIRTTVARLGRD